MKITAAVTHEKAQPFVIEEVDQAHMNKKFRRSMDVWRNMKIETKG